RCGPRVLSAPARGRARRTAAPTTPPASTSRRSEVHNDARADLSGGMGADADARSARPGSAAWADGRDAGPGAPHGAWPLVAACVGTRGYRGPATTPRYRTAQIACGQKATAGGV